MVERITVNASTAQPQITADGCPLVLEPRRLSASLDHEHQLGAGCVMTRIPVAKLTYSGGLGPCGTWPESAT